MKTDIVTLRVDKETQRQLDWLSKKLNKSRTELIRNAIEKYLLHAEFDRLSSIFTERARKKGILEEKDLLEKIS